MGTDSAGLLFSFYRLDDEFGFELQEVDEVRLLEECGRSISRGLKTVVILANSTGMRNGEIKFLRWNQIFLDDEPYLIVRCQQDWCRKASAGSSEWTCSHCAHRMGWPLS